MIKKRKSFKKEEKKPVENVKTSVEEEKKVESKPKEKSEEKKYSFYQVMLIAKIRKRNGILFYYRESAYCHAYAAFEFLYGELDLNSPCINNPAVFINKYAFSPNKKKLSLASSLVEMNILGVDYSIIDTYKYEHYFTTYQDLYVDCDAFTKVSHQKIDEFKQHMIDVLSTCLDGHSRDFD
jgi:hypothetical protein